MGLCPTCGRDRPCPTCSGDGDFLSGAPRTERFHWFRRVVTGLHQIRLSYKNAKAHFLADDLSSVIRHVERNEERGKNVDDDAEDTEIDEH